MNIIDVLLGRSGSSPTYAEQQQQIQLLSKSLAEMSEKVVELTDVIKQNRLMINNLAQVQFEMAYEYASFLSSLYDISSESSTVRSSKGLIMPFGNDDDDDLIN